MVAGFRNSRLILVNFLRKLSLQRTLLKNLVIRDLKSRYVGSLMGLFWSVIHPLVLLLTYTFVFSIILNLRPGPKQYGTDSFAVFLFCGILPWLLFQDTVSRSAMSVIEHSGLIKKTKFPIEIVPISIFLANLFSHIIGMGILLVVLLWLGELSVWAAAIPIFWICLLFFSVGLGWIMGVLQVFLRDTTQILNVVLTLWFWFTPIFYTPDRIPESLRPWLILNPMASVVVGYRDCLLYQRPPDGISLLSLILFSLLVFASGGVLFRVAKREFGDVL